MNLCGICYVLEWYIVAPQIGVGYNYLQEARRALHVIAAPQNWVGYIPPKKGMNRL